jgi:ATP-dependent helicase/nuclease subunit A
MSSNENTIQDESQRQRALDPKQSFIVQAPAGSGKTELLTQRFLVLLGFVNAPEEVLAITFTKKAAAEMRARIIKTFQNAATEPEPQAPHAKKTWLLARRALQQDAALGWDLLSNPNRLRIQTIDSFNASLIKYLPILSHFGAPPEITDDAKPLYRETVQEFLSLLEENVAWSDAIAHLLLHRDNNLRRIQELLMTMLGKRDQWQPYIKIDADQPALREELEEHLASVVIDTLTKLHAAFPKEYTEELLEIARFAGYNLNYNGSDDKPNLISCQDLTELPGDELHDLETWLGLSELLLTKDLKWRKSFDKRLGFPAPGSSANPEEKSLFKQMKDRIAALVEELNNHKKLHLALIELNYAPSSHYEETQWQTLNALHQVLHVVCALLTVTFRNHGKIDYIANAQAAVQALGTETAPTDLALALDYQIKHILIDEFQDTSNSQYRLIEKLIAGWEPNDGRTLFVVGDPMQSIYRFREAEVGLFIRARRIGISHVKLEPLTLSVNFRSTPIVVDWINTHFQKVLSPFEDIATGAVSYSHSIANQANENENSSVKTHVITEPDKAAQAEAVVKLIVESRQHNPGGTIAILVRARTHLEYIIPQLKKANLIYRAIKIDPLDSRPVIQDLMALTRALLNPADRVAWLAILRGPWCGLSLSDLLVLSGNKQHQAILEVLKKSDLLAQVSADGQARLARSLPVLASKMAERKRSSLRLWVESTWLSLGGPACLDQASDLEDVTAYFSLLEKLDVGSDLVNLDDLEIHVKRLFAAPNNQADNTLQIMTIHNAKGLEFDTVILPYLERLAPNDEKQLLLWMEKPRENAPNALVLAPVSATGKDSDSIYNYIKEQHKIKSDNEIGRLLYVAATRAKKHLHLFFSPSPKKDNADYQDTELSNSKVRSLLDKLMPAIQHEIRYDAPIVAKTEIAATEETKPRLIKRLGLAWQNPIHEIMPILPAYHQKLPGFQLSQDNPKHIGTVIHKIFEMISLNGKAWWENHSETQSTAYLEMHLLQQGVMAADIEQAVVIIHQAIHNVLHDERGQWILDQHTEAQSELALTAIIDNEATNLIIDRTFIDKKGTRWIVDYKTSSYVGENLEKFLTAEQREYADKMLQYYQAIKQLDDKPVRLGLYFPLIPAWREWQIE